MTTVTVDTTGVLPAPAAIVWELLTDWENQGDWMLEASDFVVLGSLREGVGVEAEATVSIAGITTRDRIRVSAWEPERRLEIVHGGWVSGRGEFQLTPRGEDTHVLWREQLEPPLGILGALGLMAFKPVMAHIFARDFRILASLCRMAAQARPV